MIEKAKRKELRWRFLEQLPLLVGLVVLWMLLWGSFSWLNLVTGVILAFLVTRFFYLPPVELSGRLNPWWLLVFLVQFALELVVASFQVAWQAVSPTFQPRNSVIAVQLLTRSDFITTATAISLSLIPGSIVVEVDRGASILYLHVLNTPDRASVEQFRAKALGVERKLVRALGSKDDLERARS
jgi:multicomponent Na+:H+ antiporter subunit E